MSARPSELATGSITLTDNWLLQNVAELLEQSIDPGSEAEWLDIASNGTLIHRPISAGAVHTMCLVSLLEQIVFCDSLLVMNEWIDAWAGESQQIDRLLKNDIVVGLESSDTDLESRSRQYRHIICRSDALTNESNRAEEIFRNGESDFVGQVLNGTAPYLVHSDSLGYAYSPHPVRARILERTLYRISPFLSARQRLEEIVNNARVKLHHRIGYDSIATILATRLPSIALLCLQESSQNSPPIETALQIRESSEFGRLRSALHEMQVALASESTNGTEVYLEHSRALEAALREVERRLRLRELDSEDGIAEINVWRGIKARVPELLRQPVITPRHTTAIYRMVLSSGPSTTRILNKAVGIGDPRIVKDILEFTESV